MSDNLNTKLELDNLENREFVKTPFIEDIVNRAYTYLKSGFPVHFCGSSGTGKTTLALYVGGLLGNPITLIHGNEDCLTSELIGGYFGYRRKLFYDNFIRTVIKSDEVIEKQWIDGRLTEACLKGNTLIYDEFTRSRPETNNVLLPVLEGRILQMPLSQKGRKYLEAHPDFSAIFTSNPEEYAGVYKSQDALRDRMITIYLENHDEETEVAVTSLKSGLGENEAKIIVRMVRNLRKQNKFPTTIRSSIMIAKVIKTRNLKFDQKNLYRYYILRSFSKEKH